MTRGLGLTWAGAAVAFAASACGGDAFSSNDGLGDAGSGSTSGAGGSRSGGSSNDGGSVGSGGSRTGGGPGAGGSGSGGLSNAGGVIGAGGVVGSGGIGRGGGFGTGGVQGAGGDPAAGGSSGGNCPDNVPPSGAACSPDGLQCSYGECCPTFASCAAGHWQIAVSACPAPACPPSAPADGDPCLCMEGLSCTYDNCAIGGGMGMATCSGGKWGVSGATCPPPIDYCSNVACVTTNICMASVSKDGDYSTSCIFAQCLAGQTNLCECIFAQCTTQGGTCSEIAGGVACFLP